MTIDDKKEYIRKKVDEGRIQRRKMITKYLKDGGLKVFDVKTLEKEVPEEPIITVNGKQTQ